MVSLIFIKTRILETLNKVILGREPVFSTFYLVLNLTSINYDSNSSFELLKYKISVLLRWNYYNSKGQNVPKFIPFLNNPPYTNYNEQRRTLSCDR